jgi:serine/threonine protein kinase
MSNFDSNTKIQNQRPQRQQREHIYKDLNLYSLCNHIDVKNNTLDREINCSIHELNDLESVTLKYNLKDNFKNIKIKRVLGSGTFNSVYGIHIQNEDLPFVLRFTKSKYQNKMKVLQNELIGLRYQALFSKSIADQGYGCPNIAKVYDFGYYSINKFGNITLVMEKVPHSINENRVNGVVNLPILGDNGAYGIIEKIDGGDLYTRMHKEQHKYTIKEIKTVMINVLKCLDCLHKNGVVHLDLKPENICLVHSYDSNEETKNTDIKVIDFGFCQKIGAKLGPIGERSMKGTPLYISRYFYRDMIADDEFQEPEYNYVYDIGSFGVILLDLLFGIIHSSITMPNYDDHKYLIDMINMEKGSPPRVIKTGMLPSQVLINILDSISPNLSDFLQCIFQPSNFYSERGHKPVHTASELLKHAWLQNDKGGSGFDYDNSVEASELAEAIIMLNGEGMSSILTTIKEREKGSGKIGGNKKKTKRKNKRSNKKSKQRKTKSTRNKKNQQKGKKQ